MARNKRPENPINDDSSDSTDHESQTARPRHPTNLGLLLHSIYIQRNDNKAHTANEPRPRMRALREPIKHGKEVDGSENGHHVGIAVAGSIRETAPHRTEDRAEAAREEVEECAAYARVHHYPGCDDDPPAFVLGPPGRDGEEGCDEGDFEGEAAFETLEPVEDLP
ncbi:uncharacterized protein KY384_009255 [Bacidia gigantensis]|uniref:uncharacterized protein n=1 Tax=Bacidia gigantensis TaxID=2732470 RepID=UPI001D03AB60|nr:uncharacterized protein KY384_009255 [Bacidia gigantensis]KAG8525611.1 hypothetical protein KY384_009255 [Bacidia gigantensis]